jgi:hypothetical protein
MPASYRVSTWDHEADAWTLEAANLGLWALRGAIRDLRGFGWDDPTILVEREDPEHPARATPPADWRWGAR